MNGLDEKKYLLNDEPCSGRMLMIEASELDPTFGQDGFFFTSVAAEILRSYGNTVGYNPEYKKGSGKLTGVK